MRFATHLDHKKFFYKNRHIAFLEILSEKEILSLKKGADLLLSQRCKCAETALIKKPTHDLFLQGRDFWREDPSCKKIALHPNLANISASLVGAHSLRMGYDHYLSKGVDALHLESCSLQEISSISKIVGGMLFRLSGESSENESFPTPKKPGDAIFYHPDFLMDWKELFGQIGNSFYLVIYAEEEARYVPTEKDPLPYFLKKAGYMQGEFLKNNLNPLFAIKPV